MITTKRRFEVSAMLALAGLIASLLFLPGHALSQAPFYQGKTFQVVSARRPGGLGEMRVRALLPFLPKHIPGSPTIVLQAMPGAGGRKAANHLYGAVRPDGLTVANIGAGFVTNAVLGQPGVKYDIDKMRYLGSGNSRTSYVLGTRKDAGLNTLERLRASSGVRIGAQSVGHDIYVVGRLFAWLLGLKDPKFVTGYSGPELDLAVLRGEVDGRANVSDMVLKRSPHWIEKGLVDFHVVLEIPKGFRMRHPAFVDLPALESFAKTDMERKIVGMFRNFNLIGSPYILPPGVPGERIKTLQEGFRRSLSDPELPKTWTRLTGEVAFPLMPEEQERAISEIPRDPAIIALFKKIAGPGPLPPRTR